MTVGPAMDMPIMHDSDRYDFVRDIGSGNFGVARLMRDKHTKELVAVKYIERGDKVSFVISLVLSILLWNLPFLSLFSWSNYWCFFLRCVWFPYLVFSSVVGNKFW